MIVVLPADCKSAGTMPERVNLPGRENPAEQGIKKGDRPIFGSGLLSLISGKSRFSFENYLFFLYLW